MADVLLPSIVVGMLLPAPGADVPATDVADVPATDVADVPATDVADVPANELADVPANELADVPANDMADVRSNADPILGARTNGVQGVAARVCTLGAPSGDWVCATPSC